ncbi:MAG: zf-HC2 domain-containing protein [Myxococcota bacterium]|jgi:anti-sigma factor RsiW|nr:zf-HC2 domain-containing protein [Myxococcota bacterium]
MDHERAQSLFMSYHDAELPAREVEALEAHLAQCTECSLAWQGYKAAVEEISGLLKVTPAPDFSKRVQQAIGRRSRGRFFSESSDSGGLGIAIVSVILVLVFALLYLLIATSGEVKVVDPGASSDPKGAASP